jgi:hypothetical protein
MDQSKGYEALLIWTVQTRSGSWRGFRGAAGGRRAVRGGARLCRWRGSPEKSRDGLPATNSYGKNTRRKRRGRGTYLGIGGEKEALEIVAQRRRRCSAAAALWRGRRGREGRGVDSVTPDFPKKTKCIPICMPGSSFMHIVT